MGGRSTTIVTMSSSPSRLARWGGLLALALLASVRLAPAKAVDGDLPSIEAGLTALYADVRPAVVSIVSHRGRLVGDRQGARRVALRRLVASGVIVDEAGSLVTSDQAAQPGDSLVVYLSDGRVAGAQYLGGNPAIHISLLQLSVPKPVPALRAAGEWDADLLPEWMATIAYGPWQGSSPGAPALMLSHRDAVQTTRVPCGDSLAVIWRIRAPFHPGNSGGALVSLDGQWLGLITGALASSDSPSSMSASATGNWDSGLAVPAATVMCAVRAIRREPAPIFGFLGVSTYRPGQVQRDSLRGAFGVVVSEVLHGSPADLAGVIPGDIILRYGGRPVAEVMELTRMVAETTPGALIVVDVQRDGVARAVNVRIGDRAEQESTLARQSRESTQRNALLREIQRYETRIAQLRKELQRLEAARSGDEARSAGPSARNPG